jgi:taurine transport system substrate-binding protein
MLTFQSLKKIATAALGSACVVSLSACGTMPTAAQLVGLDSASAKTTKCPVDSDTSFTGTVRIAWQAIPNADLIVKDKGLLEACLPKATIKWNQFSSGGDVIQAFGSDSLDIGLAGSSPAVQASSAPLNLSVQVVWIHDIIGEAESLVAHTSGSGATGKVTSIEGLSGKNIAVPFGSTSHFSLLNALSQAGMDATSVNLINLAPDKMAAAWTRGEIDAAWVWDPVLSKLSADGGSVVTSSAETAKKGAATYDMELASTSFIKKYPDVMKTWTAVEDYAAHQIASNPKDSAESVSSQIGNTPEEALAQFKGYTYPDATAQSKLFDTSLPKVLAATATFLKDQGTIDATKANYDGALYRDALKAVAAAGQ